MTRSIGIPYARAGVDASGYFVTCPVCGKVLRGSSKMAPARYAVHFEETHEENPGDREPRYLGPDFDTRWSEGE